MADDDAQRAADPATAPEDLAALAAARPDLRATIAQHPAAWPELLSWLEEHGDAAARAAVASRLSAPSHAGTAVDTTASETPPTAGRRHGGVILAVVAGGLAVLLAIVVTAFVVSRATGPSTPDAEETEIIPTSTPTPTFEAAPLVADLPLLPIAPVTVSADGSTLDLNAVQRFANDVAAGATDSLVSKCWTFAPATILDRYASDAARGAVLDAFARGGQFGERGASWSGEYVDVFFTWPELESTYACPFVSIIGVNERLSSVDAAYFVHRLAGRVTGAPVASLDTELNYPLLCDAYTEFWPFSGDGDTPPVLIDPAPVNAAVVALDGHPIEVVDLEVEGGGYYEVRSPEVAGAAIIVRSGGVSTCVGEAR